MNFIEFTYKQSIEILYAQKYIITKKSIKRANFTYSTKNPIPTYQKSLPPNWQRSIADPVRRYTLYRYV